MRKTDGKQFAFTKELYELLVEKKLELNECLRIMEKGMAGRKGKKEKGCTWIREAITAGSSFYFSVKNCPYFDFDRIYLEFLSLAEKTGALGATVCFLYEREKRRKENLMKLWEGLLYPLFVIGIVFAAVFYVSVFGKKLFGLENLLQNREKEIFLSIVVLGIVCGILIYGLYLVFCEDKLYEAFTAIDFLVKSGSGFAIAIKEGEKFIGEETKLGKKLGAAGEMLESGIELSTAFNFVNEKLSRAFYFAQQTGDESRVFERVAGKLKEDSTKRQILCLKLIEPVFILIAGAFLLSVIINLYLPLMNGINYGNYL